MTWCDHFPGCALNFIGSPDLKCSKDVSQDDGISVAVFLSLLDFFLASKITHYLIYNIE